MSDIIVQETGNILSAIERMAVNPDVNITVIEKMFELQERFLNRQREEAFAADYVKVKPLLPRVARTKKNTQTNSNYAPLEDINNIVDPILAEYGFATSCSIKEQTDKSVTVVAKLVHKSGHFETCPITMPLDDAGIKGTVNKTLPHATASSITYAKRVAICALLNISTGDDKDGNGIGKLVSSVQAEIIKELVMECPEATQEWFMKKYGSAQEVLKSDFDKLVASLKNVKEKTKKPKTEKGE